MQGKIKKEEKKKKRVEEEVFPVGSEVEVSSDEEGYRGAWYVATVINNPNSTLYNNKVLVEYKHLFSDESGSTLLKEYVDLAFIRPKPPNEVKDEIFFEVNDVVDAFYQDGWWTGVVINRQQFCRYIVSFTDPPAHIPFHQSDLRIHRNWVYGKWLLPEKQRMAELNSTPGTAVEVNIDLDNSRDSWFPAALIEKIGDNSFAVEYQYSTEVGPVQVSVDSLHIRPSPPRSSSISFNLLDKVDAFYDYRWLSGVVTKILADRRYIVYFKRTKKEKDLCHADLRLPMDWTNGKWVHSSQDNSLPLNSKTKSVQAVNGGYKGKFSLTRAHNDIVKNNVGEETLSSATMKKVLHISDSEDANFDGTTPSNERGKRMNTNGDSTRLKSSYQLNENSGLVVEISPNSNDVNMKQNEGSNNGTQADLDISTHSNHTESSLRQSEDSDQPSASTENKGDGKKHSTRRKRGRPRKLQAFMPDAVIETLYKSDEGSPVEPIVIGLTHDGQMTPSISESTDQHMEEDPKKTVEDEQKHYDTSADYDSEVNDGGEPERESEVTNLKRKRGRPPKALFGTPKRKKTERVEGNKDAISDASDTPDPERHSPTDEIKEATAEIDKPVSVVVPVGISDLTPSTSYRERHLRKLNSQIKHPNPKNAARRVLRKHRSVSKELVKDKKGVIEPVRQTFLRRGRQRYCKQPGKPTEVVPVGISDLTPSTGYRERHLRKLNSQIKHPNPKNTARRVLRKCRSVSKELVKDKEGVVEPLRQTFLRRGRQRYCKQPGKPTKVAVDYSRDRSAEVFDSVVAKDVEAVVVASSNVSDDDRPLSFWFDGALSPLTTYEGNVSQCDETGEKQNQEKMHPVAQPKEKAQEKSSAENASQDDSTPQRPGEIPIQSTAIVLRINEDLPFVKSSLVWKMIESMDVFKWVPQNPHFRPLYNCKEECREGLAIGNMVTFSSLVERVSSLKLSDPKSLLDGYLEALVDLEKMGFNVVPVRDQLNTLLALKGRHEHAQNTYKEIENQVLEMNHEKSKIDEEIVELEKKIADLDEKRRLAVSNKETKESEIASLQSNVETIRGSLESAEQEFAKVTSSHW